MPPPYDIGLVEGSISTPEEEERIRQIRRDCRMLVTIGACATLGGIQALWNWADVEEFARWVYAHPEYLHTLDTSTPIAAHVFVDFELRGCPINADDLLELVRAAGRTQAEHLHPQRLHRLQAAGLSCVLVAQGQPCLGPITQVGCGALCPSLDRACYGCFGPMEHLNMASLGHRFTERLGQPCDMKRMLRLFNGYLEPFKQTSDHYERQETEAAGDHHE